MCLNAESKTRKPRDHQALVSNLESPPQTPLLSQTDFIILCHLLKNSSGGTYGHSIPDTKEALKTLLLK